MAKVSARAGKLNYEDNIRLSIKSAAGRSDGQIQHLSQVVFDSEEALPLFISEADTQQLMNDLWKLGFRPWTDKTIYSEEEHF